MRRLPAILAFGLVLGLSDRADPQAPADRPPDAEPKSDAAAANETAEFEQYREIILDDNVDPKNRRGLAELVLKRGNGPALELAMELLSASSSGGARLAMTEAIVSVGSRQPEILQDRLLDPLILLLEQGDPAVAAKAAFAIALFRQRDVAPRLRSLAADASKPVPGRLAAIAALELALDHREAVRELMSLLSDPTPAVADRALAALRLVARVDHGSRLDEWQRWWADQESLSDVDWLRERLNLARLRNQELRQKIQGLEQAETERRGAVAERINGLLRTIYQLTPTGPPREVLLQAWLSDSFTDYPRTALGILRDQIAAGDSPSAAVRESVVRCGSDPAADVRIAALGLIENLKDPKDAPAVLALLETEKVLSVRETALRVLGRLENVAALPALIAELNDAQADPHCVREAASAIGSLVNNNLSDPALARAAVAPLGRRLAEAPADNLRLREALLAALARIGDPDSTAAFVTHLGSQAPELLVVAMRGLDRLGAAEHLPAILPHLAHPDPRVRQQAAQTLGSLAMDAGFLPELLARLSPEVESSENVRKTIWDAFLAVLARLPPAARLGWVDRLDRLPDRQLALLDALITQWSTTNPAPLELNQARRRLADLLIGQNRPADALGHLQQLCKAYLAQQDPQALQVVTQLIHLALRVDGGKRVPDVLLEISGAADAATRAAILQTLNDYIDAARNKNDDEAVAGLLSLLDPLPEDLLGSHWLATIQERAPRNPSPRTERP